ncbi:sensor histidine kinase [Candidatus Blastococcus massiliensis]|uniref:sensor histidine kinase n=1 Tax=Candidatus Blastococcus massiliensis TaxID=1470358 RepID=UPI0004B3B608|nr:histidine kinase [Candidatus Blastococcus massiliensis]
MPLWTASTPARRRLLWPAVGLAIAALSVVENLTDEFYGYPLVTVVPALVVGLLLAVCPRWPEAAAVAGSLAILGNFAMDTPGPGGAQLVGMGLLVGHAAAVLPRAAGVRAAVASSAVVLVTGSLFSVSPWEGVFYSVVTGAGWAVGTLVRQVQQRSAELQVLAARLAEQQDAVAAAAVTAERARIAREVHDSVAHAVSVMVLQMGGLRRLLPDHPEAQQVLLDLERLGRDSVDEMRRVVGILRDGADGTPAPQPSLSRLEPMLADLRAGGMPIELVVTGRPRELPQLVDVSAVRIVQEALSNVLRHAGAAATRVELAWAADRLTVTVTDDGRARVPSPPRAPSVGGHGQLHMRERAAVAGGRLDVGPVRGGGYRVCADFPLPRSAPGAAAPVREVTA